MAEYTREMFPVRVEHKGGRVVLTQPDPLGNGDAVIVLTPEQVPLVVAWMYKAAESARQERG
jgi:hypothetical protein